MTNNHNKIKEEDEKGLRNKIVERERIDRPQTQRAQNTTTV